MKKLSTSLLFLTVLLVACAHQDSPKPELAVPSQNTSVAPTLPEVILSSPSIDEKISSPATIQGSAKGTWFSEGMIPVSIIDADGNVLALEAAEADGEWMTEEQVKFSVTVKFETTAKSGFIVIEKDNPSGLPENAKKAQFPVTF